MSFVGHTAVQRGPGVSQTPTPAQLQSTHPYPASNPSNQSTSDDETFALSPAPSEEITQLARHLSTQPDTGDMFNYEKGSILDPFAEKFDARVWMSRFASLDDWSGVQGRKSGISFKNLTVFGYGTDAGESDHICNVSCG